MTMLFNVLNRWTGKVQFTAKIDCSEGAPRSIKLGLAVRWALKSGVVLSCADLSCADLRAADLRGADLSGADLSGADLSGADLRGVVLRGADLSCADLRGAVLSGADLRGVVLRGAEIPSIPHIDAAILASIEANKAAGKNGLKMATWHDSNDCDESNWCQTTHCRAGYAICLAGAAGFALEKKVGPAAAGALIYAKSRPDQPVPNFYDSDENAMADIRRAAEADQLPVKP
jgi:hypothetical protein